MNSVAVTQFRPSAAADARPIGTLWLIGIYFFLCTLPVFEMARVTLAEVLLLAVLVPLALARGMQFHRSDAVYLAFLFYCLLRALLFADLGEGGVVDMISLTVPFLGLVVLRSLYLTTPGLNVGSLLTALLYAAAVSAAICLFDFFILGSSISGRVSGALTGTFRNQGQSGTYFAIVAMVLIPAIGSGVVNRRPLHAVLMALILVALALTFRRSAILALLAGYMCYVFFAGGVFSVKRIVVFLVALVGASVAVTLAIASSEQILNKFDRKFGELSEMGSGNSFITDNIQAAVDAFTSNPLFGAGIGNIVGTFSEEHEIHNGYLWILSQTGLIGMALFILWLAMVAGSWWKAKKEAERDPSLPAMNTMFLVSATPFLLGLVLINLYARVFRLREFFIVLSILAFQALLVERRRARR